ncbi:tRNA 2-selenouridine(34) synthase MnmH [Chitinophaga niabensis]|uniref:tRNA 2-selenouridine(34) synthase MnmH n=1 Tax=Chitinophaga niabensis TaxID=536979 RepID=UPI0031BAA47B
MIRAVTIKDLIALQGNVPLADVRTPAEFEHGHMPGAFNLPIFSNEERVEVGTTYKQQGKEAAILLGFDLTGNKWSGFVREALKMAPAKKIALHCWRGGMRSGAMAWALDLYGFEVYLVKGGYKSYRRWVLEQFEEKYPLLVLGGKTGSGKTKILHQMLVLGEQMIDLEEIAQHQGSSYGTMNKLVQPTQEQFENNLADQLAKLDKQRKIWIEDESLTIGKRFIPKPFWNQMEAAILIDIKVPDERRVQTLVQEYGVLDKDFLVECTERIHKRLGPEQTKKAVAAIREGRMSEFIQLVLVYYDKTYRTGLSRRHTSQVFPIELVNNDLMQNAIKILDFAHSEATTI